MQHFLNGCCRFFMSLIRIRKKSKYEEGKSDFKAKVTKQIIRNPFSHHNLEQVFYFIKLFKNIDTIEMFIGFSFIGNKQGDKKKDIKF